MEQLLVLVVIGLAFGAYKVWNVFKENKALILTAGDRTRNISELYAEVLNLKYELTEAMDDRKSLSDYVIILKNCIKEKDDLYSNLADKKEESFAKISTLMADFQTLQYKLSAEILENKMRPAPKKAEEIKQLRKKTRVHIQENKLLKYKYEYLLEVFPDLQPYVEDISALEEIEQYEDLNDLTSNTDRVKNFLSPDEYKKLPDEERNQLALDRYIEGGKTNWQIGRDYEMFIGQQYEKNGWKVEYIGIEKKLNDLGRDLIAIKEGKTLVIQCKYWAQHKHIHENSITQLYGTTKHYEMANEGLFERVTPVLITNISLSDTARDFATYLKVKIKENKKIEAFPRIKCKLGKGENGENTKIYHLPMDQQYDKAKISKNDEFYAHTVKDAVSNGYRRAYKWRNNDQSN